MRWGWFVGVVAMMAAPASGSGLSSPSAQAEAAILAQLTGTGAAPRAIVALPAFVRLSSPRPAPSSEARRALVPIAEAAAVRHGIDVEFFKRLIRQESGYNPNAVSSAGAQGIAQFMPGTAAKVGLDDPFDPHKALPKSAEHLAELRQRLGNDGLAAAAYNAGEGRVRAWLAGRSGLPLETQNYVLAITGRQAHEWAPAGTIMLASASSVAPMPSFTRLKSSEWQFGAGLLGPDRVKLATLLETPPRRASRAPTGAPARPRPSTGEAALCASVGCIVARAY